jgi:hypothetical protein
VEAQAGGFHHPGKLYYHCCDDSMSLSLARANRMVVIIAVRPDPFGEVTCFPCLCSCNFQFMEDIDKEISGMKIAINARARVVANEYMRQF